MQRVGELQSSLAAARELYTPSHPQIKKLEASVAAVEAAFSNAREESARNATGQDLDREATLNLLKTQIQMTNLEMDEKIKQVQDLERMVSSLNLRIEAVPQLEQKYAELLRQYERAKEQLTDASTAGPSLLSRTDPESAGIEGKVELAVTIGTDGIARDMQVLRSPDSALNRKAIECVAKWRFQPAMRNGQAVTAFASVEVTFK